MRCFIRFAFVLLLALPAWGKYSVVPSATKTSVQRFNLAFHLPKVNGDPALADVVEASMRQLREKERAAIAESCKEMAAPCEGDSAWGYRVALADAHLLSVVVSSRRRAKGDEHPSYATETFTWTVQTPRRVSLEDVFVDRARALRRLSRFAREQLDFVYREWMVEATEPTEENFRAWFISEKGLEIVFDESQVAAYAVGSQYVVVRFREIKDLIDPDGPLGFYTRRKKAP